MIKKDTIHTRIILTVVIAMALAIFYVHGAHKGKPEGPYRSQLTSSAKPTRSLDVLFIGNAYTHDHQFADMIAQLASSDAGNTTQLNLYTFTHQFASLPALWEEGDAPNIIRARHWDYVVLQDTSLWAMTPQGIDASNEAARNFAALIHTEKATPLFYLTWVRKPGSHWYTDRNTSFLERPEYMRSQTYNQAQLETQRIGAKMVPVGEVWDDAVMQKPPFPLYEPDGSTPTLMGSYLSALVFYHYLTNRPINASSYAPARLEAKRVIMLKNFVAQRVH